MKHLFKILLFILILAALVFGAIRLVKSRKAAEAEIPPAKEYAVIIDTLKAKKSRVTLSLPAMALSRNDKDTTLASKISTRVLSILPSGSKVHKGDVLVRLDDTALKASETSLRHALESARQELIAAEASLKNLEAVHAHSAALLKIKGISAEQFQAEAVKIASAQAKIAAIEARIAKLEADQATLENQLSYTTITAPTDGVISATMAGVGDLAMPGKPLLKLSAHSGSWLLVRLPGSAKAIRFRGKRIALKALHSTFNGLNEYRADINGSLPAGNRVECDVITFEGEAVKLPYDTLLNREGKNWILLYESGRIRPVPAPILETGQEGIALDSSLAGREVVKAKPDILLRLLGGYPVVKSPRE